MPLDIQKTLQIIKDFKPLEIPAFADGNQDTFDYMICNLYHRVCEAIKSFIVLFENERYYDSFIIAGHCLEICAILSYIKDAPTDEICRKRYNKYLASSVFGRLKYNLELRDNLETESSWNAVKSLLDIFKTVDTSIVRYNKNREEAIKQLNNREGLNRDKIRVLNEYYSKVKVREYINAFIKSTSSFGGEEFNRFYEKYCNIKHGNMMTPGASFEHNPFDCFAEDGIMLILGIMYYLKDFKF